MCEIKDLYLETFKSKLPLFNEELYQDIKEQIRNVLEESKNTSIPTTQLTIDNDVKTTNSFKLLMFELKSKGINVSIEISPHDINESIIRFNYELG